MNKHIPARKLVGVATLVLLMAVAVPPVGTALPVGDPNSHISMPLPGGGYVEVVFLGAPELLRPAVEDGADVTAYQHYADVWMHRGWPACSPDFAEPCMILENVPFFTDSDEPPSVGSCSPEGTVTLCLRPGDSSIFLVKEPTAVQQHPDGVPIWVMGAGCVKIYHPLAGQPLVINGGYLMNGALQTGGSC